MIKTLATRLAGWLLSCAILPVALCIIVMIIAPVSKWDKMWPMAYLFYSMIIWFIPYALFAGFKMKKRIGLAIISSAAWLPWAILQGGFIQALHKPGYIIPMDMPIIGYILWKGNTLVQNSISSGIFALMVLALCIAYYHGSKYIRRRFFANALAM